RRLVGVLGARLRLLLPFGGPGGVGSFRGRRGGGVGGRGGRRRRGCGVVLAALAPAATTAAPTATTTGTVRTPPVTRMVVGLPGVASGTGSIRARLALGCRRRRGDGLGWQEKRRRCREHRCVWDLGSRLGLRRLHRRDRWDQHRRGDRRSHAGRCRGRRRSAGLGRLHHGRTLGRLGRPGLLGGLRPNAPRVLLRGLFVLLRLRRVRDHVLFGVLFGVFFRLLRGRPLRHGFLGGIRCGGRIGGWFVTRIGR